MDGLDLIESETKAEVLLGCSVQSNLKWNSQVEAVQQKLKTRIGALEHLRYVLPYTFRKSIVDAIFNSALSYCLPVYGGCDQADLNMLQIMQNKAARIATDSPMMASRVEMFERLQWMTVRQLVFYHTILTTYRIRQNKQPEYLHSLMSRDNVRGNIVIPHTPLVLTLGVVFVIEGQNNGTAFLQVFVRLVNLFVSRTS